MKRGDPGRVAVTRARQEQFRRQHMLRVEARIGLLQFPETADQQPGAGQERQRQRDFGYYQRVTQTAPLSSAATPAFLESFVEIDLSGLESRRKSEQDAGQERHA